MQESARNRHHSEERHHVDVDRPTGLSVASEMSVCDDRPLTVSSEIAQLGNMKLRDTRVSRGTGPCNCHVTVYQGWPALAKPMTVAINGSQRYSYTYTGRQGLFRRTTSPPECSNTQHAQGLHGTCDDDDVVGEWRSSGRGALNRPDACMSDESQTTSSC